MDVFVFPSVTISLLILLCPGSPIAHDMFENQQKRDEICFYFPVSLPYSFLIVLVDRFFLFSFQLACSDVQSFG